MQILKLHEFAVSLILHSIFTGTIKRKISAGIIGLWGKKFFLFPFSIFSNEILCSFVISRVSIKFVKLYYYSDNISYFAFKKILVSFSQLHFYLLPKLDTVVWIRSLDPHHFFLVQVILLNTFCCPSLGYLFTFYQS